MASKESPKAASSNASLSTESERRVAFIGTGALSHAFIARAQRLSQAAATGTNNTASSFEVVVGADRNARFDVRGVQVLSIANAIELAQIVVLCIPASAYGDFVSKYQNLLAGKIVVDPSNPSNKEFERACSDLAKTASITSGGGSVAANLQASLPKSTVVKGFNDNGAYIVMNHPANEPLYGKIYSDSTEALETVSQFAQDALGMKVIMCQDLAQSSDVEKRQLTAFAGWGLPLGIALFFGTFITVYCVLRYIVWGPQNPWYTIFLFVGNKIIAWLSIWLYAFAYLPGAVLYLCRLVSAKKVIALPGWVQRYMGCRKHLGILATIALLVHIMMSFCMMSPAYYTKYYSTSSVVLPEPAGSKFTAYGTLKNESAIPVVSTLANNVSSVSFKVEHILNSGSLWKANLNVAWFLGIWAAVLMLFPAISSIPTIGSTLSWKEWVIVQSWFGIGALCLATGHVLALGIPSWDPPTWTHGMPNVSILSTVPAMFVILLRLCCLVIVGCQLTGKFFRSKRGCASKKVGQNGQVTVSEDSFEC